jgi:hypothetical protein
VSLGPDPEGSASAAEDRLDVAGRLGRSGPADQHRAGVEAGFTAMTAATATC